MGGGWAAVGVGVVGGEEGWDVAWSLRIVSSFVFMILYTL